MTNKKEHNEKAFIQLASQLSKDVENIPGNPLPYICTVLKEALAINSEGKIENNNALDLIVHDLICETSGAKSHDDEISIKIFDSSKRKILFDFLNNYVKQIGTWSLTNVKFKNEHPLLLKGMILSLVEQYETAQHYFDKATKINTESIMAWYGKALALRQQGKPEDALDALEVLLRLDPENPIVFLEKARSLNAVGEIDKSIDILLQAKKISSAKAEVYSLLSVLYLTKGNYSEALTTAKEGIWIDPKSCWLWLLKAFVYSVDKDNDQALECCKCALEFDPDYWPALYLCGFLNQTLKKYDEALSYFNRAVEIAPEVTDISLSVIRSLCDLKKMDEALAECEKLIKKNMSFTAAWEEKAKIYVLKKDWKKVIEVCQLARQKCGDNAEFWKYMGAAYDNLGDYNCSIECYDKVLPYRPEDAYAWYNKGSVLLKASVVEKKNFFRWNKYIKEALKCGKQATKIDDKFHLGWYIYGLAHFQSGDSDNGLKYLEKAAKMGSLMAVLLRDSLKTNMSAE